MKKILQIFSTIVIILFLLTMFSWMVVQISKGSKQFGVFTKPIKSMYTFPDMFKQSVEEVKTLPKTFIKTHKHFKAKNELTEDVIAITTFSDTSDRRAITLMNLRNDSVLYKWTIDNPYRETKRIWNPILFQNKELVFSFDGEEIMRIDSLANVVWRQDSVWGHHSMNLDHNGDIWVCTYAPVYYATGHYKINGRSVFFKDNFITKIDPSTGHMLFHKSVAQILIDNNMENYIIKASMFKDPIHINDIQPALKSTKYYKKGDIYISAKQPSIILHYRPSTNEVIEVIEGPFVSQHDVDFYNDTTLVIFNNNFFPTKFKGGMKPPKDSTMLVEAGNLYSSIAKYDFGSGKTSFIGDSIFRKNHIFTYTEGLVEFIDPDTYFVEEQNSGVLWVIRNDKVIYRNVYQSQHEGYHHLPNWTRIIKDYE